MEIGGRKRNRHWERTLYRYILYSYGRDEAMPQVKTPTPLSPFMSEIQPLLLKTGQECEPGPASPLVHQQALAVSLSASICIAGEALLYYVHLLSTVYFQKTSTSIYRYIANVNGNKAGVGV